MGRTLLALAILLTVPTVASAQNIAHQLQTRWGALVAAVWGDDQGLNYVTVSAAYNYLTKEAAKEAAQDKCIHAHAFGCRVISTFTGCGYISYGSRGPFVGWGAGGTSQEARMECEKRNVDCHPPIGGCNAH